MKNFILVILLTLFSGILNAAEIEAFDEEKFSFIVFAGEIESGDAYKFKKVIQDHNRYAKNPISVVVLNSFGGSVVESLKIGESIEQQKLITIVLPDHSCYSSCVVLFLAADVRYAAQKSNIGVHRISEDAADTQMARALSIDLAQYYKEAKVPDSIRLAMLETAPNEIYTLSLMEKKSISTIDLDKSFASIQTPSQRQNQAQQRTSKKYKKYYNIPDLVTHIRAIYDAEHDSNIFLRDIKNGYLPDVFNIVKNNLDASMHSYLDEYLSLAQKQINQITAILNNAGVHDLYIRNKIELDFWYNKMFDIAQFDPRTNWENNHYLCSKANCSEIALDMINLSFADHYNQLRELCVAGYCNEEMVKNQERTWIASNELTQKILKVVHPNKVRTNVPFTVSNQIININNMKFYISAGLKKTSFFKDFDYSSPMNLLMDIINLTEKLDKLSLSQIAQYNAVMGSYVLPHITYLISQKTNTQWSDKLDVAAAAYDLVYREFFVSSNRISFGPNYDKSKTELEKLYGKLSRATTFLLLFVPNPDYASVEAQLIKCKGSNCKQSEFNKAKEFVSQLENAIKGLCKSGNCNLKQFERQLKHLRHYEQTYFEILNKIKGNNSYTNLIKILYLEPITLRYAYAHSTYGKQ